MRYVNIVIIGNVQGVYFRKFTQQVAKTLNINGFVRNQQNGNVYIEAGGTNENIEKLLHWCHKGPQDATVEQVITTDMEAKPYLGFIIKRTE